MAKWQFHCEHFRNWLQIVRAHSIANVSLLAQHKTYKGQIGVANRSSLACNNLENDKTMIDI